MPLGNRTLLLVDDHGFPNGPFLPPQSVGPRTPERKRWGGVKKLRPATQKNVESTSQNKRNYGTEMDSATLAAILHTGRNK